MQYHAKEKFEHGAQPATGVLLANLGTPDAPTPAALRKYLKQFLSDPRIVEPPPPRWVWWLILNGIILTFRPKSSARLYQNIWTDEGSPLLIHSQRVRDGLEAELREQIGGPVHVALGMSYGEPSIARALRELREKNCQRILVLPLFPQYSSTTTGAIFDVVVRELTAWRWVPGLRMIDCYHDQPAYIASLAASIREHWARQGEPERILFSFHGIPQRYFHAGDPYHCHCQKTARLLGEALGIEPPRYAVGFQSQFGREPWLQPYTEETLRSWGKEGVLSDVICPGFACDCLETLEEINITYREAYEEAGKGKLRYIPCLNERSDHVDALAQLARQHLQGWCSDATEWDESASQARADQCEARYKAMREASPNRD